MRKPLQALALLAILAATPVWAGSAPGQNGNTPEAATFNGEIIFTYQLKTYTVSALPVFSAHHATQENSIIAKDINWDSHAQAWQYRTRLRAGLKEAADFNGHYKIVTHGCGSGCQRSWIIDQTTGNVLGDLTTGLGIHYCKDSNLIITDLTSNSTTQELMQYQPPEFGAVTFYEVKAGRLELVKKVDLFKYTGLRQ